MNLTYALFTLTLHVLLVYCDSTIAPVYANCSTLPLYGRKGVPSLGDINHLITVNGWFEGLLGAIVLANASAIEQSLYDPEDGTVQVTLTSTAGDPQQMTFPKKPFPSDIANCGVARFNNVSSSAWVSAMYDGLTSIFDKDSVSSATGVGPKVARGLHAIQGNPGSALQQSCLVLPIRGTQSLYELSSSVPVVAAMYPNATDPHYANRMVAVTSSDSPNSTTNSVSFASISVFGQSGISHLPWSKWVANCEAMFST